MDVEYITTLRTGASAAHSVMMYAKKDFKTIGLFGLGNIMFACIVTSGKHAVFNMLPHKYLLHKKNN